MVSQEDLGFSHFLEGIPKLNRKGRVGLKTAAVSKADIEKGFDEIDVCQKSFEMLIHSNRIFSYPYFVP